MTTVHFALDRPGAAGPVMLAGTWSLRPLSRQSTSTLVVVPGAVLVTPDAADVTAGAFSYAMTPGYWTVTEPRPGITRVVLIPDSVTAVEYASLDSIDPATLSPAAAPTPAWTEALAQATAGLAGKVDTATYNDFHALVVNALTAAQSLNDSQTQQIAALQSTLASLTSRVGADELNLDGGHAAG